ncbi:MAG: lysophospholipid acyltransferase family protein [Thermodesulfobacteriota bacterium]
MPVRNNPYGQLILHALYQPYKWLVYIPVLALTTAFFGSLAFLIALMGMPRLGSLVGGVTWARINSYMTPMFVRVVGREHIDKRRSYVVVSNHQSHFDIFVLYGWLGVDFKWVMKSALRKIPFLGIACEKLEHIYIDRSNTQSAIDSINQAKTRIVNGTSVLFFPEGTRSETSRMGPFKKGAFRFAADLGLPILPITIVGTGEILPKNTVDLFPGRVLMTIHPPIDIHGYDAENLEILMDKVRSVIESALPPD